MKTGLLEKILSNIPELKEPEEIFHYPTQAEVDAQIEEKIQNETHGTQCGDCEKAVNQTPNPKAVMRYCRFNGVMVSKYQACCGEFKQGVKDAWM